MRKHGYRKDQLAQARKHGYNNPDELIRAEYRKGKIAPEIAVMLDLTPQSIYNKLGKLGIKKNQGNGNRPYINALYKRLNRICKHEGYPDVDTMCIEEYKQIKNIPKTAKKLGVSVWFIHKRLKDRGIKRISYVKNTTTNSKRDHPR